LSQVAENEQAGIPTVSLLYADQDECFHQAAKLSGSPGLRRVHVSRTLQGPEDVERFFPAVFDALTRPLTKEEQKSGRLDINLDRVLFEGTLDEAQDYYQQTERFSSIKNSAPISKYTDGLPIIIPTEERVAAMLKGTSHKPDERITFQSHHKGYGGGDEKGSLVVFQPVGRVATVEQVAVNAVWPAVNRNIYLRY
jgi:hypothetical protein